jgi:hypothetical protein
MSVPKKLQSVWGKARVPDLPGDTEIKDNLRRPARERRRSPRAPEQGGVQVNLRITRAEKKRFELLAMLESVTLNEMFSRMLALYEREHGTVELKANKAEDNR